MRTKTRQRAQSPRFTIETLETRVLLAGQVVAYFPEYRYTSHFNKIDWNLITHINYFSIFANDNGSLNTANVTPARLQNAVAAAHANGDKISIVIGPQNLGTMAGNATARAAFVTNILNYCNTYNLDGVDLDWEPKPTGSNITHLGNLVDALYAQMNPQGLLLTAAVYPLTPNIPLATVAKIDWLNVMGYNFQPNDHTNLADTITSLNQWANWGVPKSKIVMGTGFYGKRGDTWQTSESLSYATIINNYYNSHSQTYPPPSQDLIDTWYTAGPDTTRAKAEYIRDNGYGGMMIWELGHDHFNAAGQFTPASLLPVIGSVLISNPEPVQVLNSSFGFATSPHTISFQFNRDVSASLQPLDLTVQNVNTLATIIVADVNWDPGTLTATFVLNGAVADGRYLATLSGSGVVDNTGAPLGTDATHDFAFLRGDANGDETVDLLDFNILANNFGQSGRDFTQGNFSYDAAGNVDLDDFNILTARFGTNLPPASFANIPIGSPSKSGRIIDTIRDDVLA